MRNFHLGWEFYFGGFHFVLLYRKNTLANEGGFIDKHTCESRLRVNVLLVNSPVT